MLLLPWRSWSPLTPRESDVEREGGTSFPSSSRQADAAAHGRIGNHRASPRYKKSRGKAAWLFQPERTQFWVNYIDNEDLARDPTTIIGKEFKDKFRISYSMFERILADTRESGEFADELARKAGQKAHPLAMKVMAGLRRLALGIPVDGLSDMVGISNTLLHKFIPKWEAWFVTKYYDDAITVPTGPALQHQVKLFHDSVLAGFVSSMDVVHIRYDRCPYAQRPNYKGKEGYPTVAYQFHVGHNYEIH